MEDEQFESLIAQAGAKGYLESVVGMSQKNWDTLLGGGPGWTRGE